MNFAPLDGLDPGTHRRQIAGAANAALRGESHNTGVFGLAAGQTSFALRHPLIGAGKTVFLSPGDATAAGLHWWVDAGTLVKGGVTLRFTAAPASACTFNYAVVGVKPYAAQE